MRRIFWFLILLSGFAFSTSYKFVSGPQGGNWFVLGGAISSYFSENGIETTNSVGGGVGNIININRGHADLGFTVGSLLGSALAGNPKFQGKVDNVVVLANLYPQVTYFVARSDFVKSHGIKSLGDAVKVKGLRIATLNPGTASEFVVSSILSDGYGVDWRSIRRDGGKVQFTSYSDGANLIADNNIDIFAFSVGEVASIVFNIESQADVVILPVDHSVIEKVGEKYGTGTYVIRPGVYKGVTSDVPTVGDYNVLIVRKNLDDATVTKMSKVLFDSRERLANAVKDFASFGLGTVISSTLPMHEAAKFYFESLRLIGH